MAKSNYEITQERMEIQFLSYDQEKMIRKFHLEYDEEYLYILFIKRKYRIGRKDGQVAWSEDGFVTCTKAGFHEAMSIYDVLCCSSDDCHLAGEFVPIDAVNGTVVALRPGMKITGAAEKYFDQHTEQLRRACLALGGVQKGKGDVAYQIDVFEFLPVILEFWNGDEEFPPSMQFLWDRNVIQFLHFETSFYVRSHLLERIQEIMG